MNLFYNCSRDKIWKDDGLSISRMNYTGSQIKIDGYYYKQKDNFFYDAYIFFNNGVIIAAGGTKTSLAEMDEYLRREFVNSLSFKKFKVNWGVFQVAGNRIQFERWYPSDPPLKAYIKEGEVMNDTTFVIREIYRNQGGQKTEVESLNETYYFRHFSPKPDSTNNFVP